MGAVIFLVFFYADFAAYYLLKKDFPSLLSLFCIQTLLCEHYCFSFQPLWMLTHLQP